METGNSYFNSNSLEWPKLESRRLENKQNLFQKARLKLVDITTDHLKIRQTFTRRDRGGPTYTKNFSKLDAHIFSLFAHSTTREWTTTGAANFEGA